MNRQLAVGLVFFAALASAAYWVTSTELSASSADSIVNESILEDWGYRSLGSNRVSQTEYQKEVFGEAEIRTQSIRASEAIEGMPGYFCSFVIVEETYPSVDAASKRRENLHAHETGLSSKMNAEFVLRDGFQVQNRVLFASTEVTLFHKVGMPSLLEKIREMEGVISE
jgi:hypothetical protein